MDRNPALDPVFEIPETPEAPPQGQHAANPGTFRFQPPKPRRNHSRSVKEERSDRRIRYDRIEHLTRELSAALRDEMARRKDLWDSDGDQEEEAFWEGRKQEVYKGLEQLADEIQKAFRDRHKEAVLDLWGKEREERTAQATPRTNSHESLRRYGR
jgi:hypothetical protein